MEPYLGAETPLDQAHAMAERRGARVAVAVCTLPGTAREALARITALADPGLWVLAGPDTRADGPQARLWGPGLDQARAQAAALLGPGPAA